MSSWLNQTKLVNEIANNMLLPKRLQYHEDFIRFKMNELKDHTFSNFCIKNGYNQRLKASLFHNAQSVPSSCIIYLHGYGSHRLEGVTILSSLPKSLAFCCFDFTGSGKSQGNTSTYGLKEYQDIPYILDKLKQYGFKEFILWGRSMGAVASLLYTSKFNDKSIIFQVLDSPFSSFQNIAKFYAKKSMNFPQLFIDFGVSIIKQKMKAQKFNPFLINLEEIVKDCTVPALFVYSDNDKTIHPENTMKIIKNFNPNTRFEKLLIEEGHNSIRCKETLRNIFQTIEQYKMKMYKKKQKKGFYQVLSSQVSPRTTRNSEDENPRAKRIQCSLSKNSLQKTETKKKLKIGNLKESPEQAYCLDIYKKTK